MARLVLPRQSSLLVTFILFLFSFLFCSPSSHLHDHCISYGSPETPASPPPHDDHHHLTRHKHFTSFPPSISPAAYAQHMPRIPLLPSYPTRAIPSAPLPPFYPALLFPIPSFHEL